MMVPTIAMAILMGVLPDLFLRPMEPSVVRAVDRITGAQPARASNPRGLSTVPASHLPTAASRAPETASRIPETDKRQASHD